MKGLCILTLSVMLVAGAAFSQETAPKGVSAFNDYVRKALKYGDDKMYKVDDFSRRDMELSASAAEFFRPLRQANVMADLAWAMKYNPNLKIQLNAGYFDLATPFYEGIYEMRQLPMPAKLQDNI